MGLFDKIFNKPSQMKQAQNYFETLTAYAPVFSTWNGALYESELVRSAIDARARHISKLKFDISGDSRKALANKLTVKPNSWMTWSQFLYRTSTILDMQNTAFIVPVLNEFGEVTGFYPVLPSRCEIVDSNGEPYLKYSFSNGKTAAIEFSLCAVLTKYQYKDDFFGERNNALNNTLNLIDLQGQGIQEAIKNSASYRFTAQLTNVLKPEDIARERKRFSRDNLEGEGGGILLFPSNYQNAKQIIPHPYTIDTAQMEYIRTNVYNYFGVNESIMQNKASGDSFSAFYDGAIEPFCVQFSEAVTPLIFTEPQIRKGCSVMLTANKLQYITTQEKLNVSAQLADRGILSINEIREIWSLPPVEGGDMRPIRGEYYDAGNDNEPQEPSMEETNE